MLSFIEKQFPVSKVSKESYKERKAGASQTLTGLGKWWGRKPLVLVRAAILGCLMPASDNPKRDMEIFLKIMSMDSHGLLLRKEKSFTAQEMYDLVSKDKKLAANLSVWFDTTGNKVKLNPGVDKKEVEKRIFYTLGYDQKLTKCIRPEQLENLDGQTWKEINHHLGTNAENLPELIRQLSVKRFGRNVRVGDCFCGGGSIPFEAARLGCDTYASDLNPIAGLLTWASINICGAGEEELAEIKKFQQEVFEKVDQEITELGIEHNELGDRAVSYLYCVEAVCPECGVKVPLAPSWVIGKGTKTVAKLTKSGNGYEISVKMGSTADEMKQANDAGTVSSRGMICPHCGKTTPITALRKDRRDENGNTIYGLRQWEQTDFDFREEDIYSERLYAIKYEQPDGKRYYRAPNERDLQNEVKVKKIVADNIVAWQEQGLIPSMEIEDGDKTKEVMRNRGWTHWNHLFNARQLLTTFLIVKTACQNIRSLNEIVTVLLGLNRVLNWNSKLCGWDPSREDNGKQTFYNQALNTLFNYTTRSSKSVYTCWMVDFQQKCNISDSIVSITDARTADKQCHFWITDPPYADAINYHELSEFFLAWDKTLLLQAFPEWYTDSKRILAVKGDEHFSQSMIEIYSNLTKHMDNDGLQVVMFTHSDTAVWAQLALIMWKAGLKVCAAWNIATETDASGLKDGNYVKGTVLLVLRKQTGDETAYLDEINVDIKNEVKTQIESMQELNDKEEPNFSDPDYVLAAYAASLKVLTAYKNIGELDLDYELNLAINDPARSKVVSLIERAKKIAFDFLIPAGFERYLWKDLTSAERFYIKGLESEKRGNYQISTYQEFARGFAIGSYSQLMANEKANTARLKTPVEFAMRTINELPDFEKSTLRLILAAIYIAIKEEGRPEKGLFHIKNNLPDYWGSREMVKQLLALLQDTKDIGNMPHWAESAEMAAHLYVLVENDHI